MKTLGFLGLGIMGLPMAQNLLPVCDNLVVWNRHGQKASPLVAAGARQATSPAEVVAAADITCAMLADPAAAEAVCFGPQGVLEAMGPGKSYVDFSTVDADTSQNIASAIDQAGGRFLEAPVSGSKQPAVDGQLIILAAGDQSLFEEMSPALAAVGKASYYLGATGQGARLKLVVNMIMGGMMAAFGEGLNLSRQCGISPQVLLEVLAQGAMANPMFAGKGARMLDHDFTPAFPLKHMHKDLRLAVELAMEHCQGVNVAPAALDVFSEALAADLGDQDFSAVFKIMEQ